MALNAAKAVLKQGKTALFVCDMQERFATVIYEFDKIATNSSKLIKACKILNVPILVAEQNPAAFGKTVPQLDITGAKGPFAKFQFSMITPEVIKELSKLCNNEPPESIILIGVESHACVENTAIDLRQSGYEVHTVADCCSSRTQEDRLLSFERMKQIGCQIATSENVILKLLQTTKHPDFKEILTLIKPLTLSTGLAPTSKI